MYANLLLGLRDIWKHKLFVVTCSAFLVVFSIIIIAVSIDIYVELEHQEMMKAKMLETFTPVYTQYDLSYSRETLESISGIYEQNAVSHRLSQSLTNLYGRPVYLVFGDGSLINPGIVNHNGITAYAYDNCDLDYIEILGVKHEVKPVLSFLETFQFSGFVGWDPFPDEDSIFVVYQGEAMIDIIHLMSDRIPERFFEIIGDTWIVATDSQRINDFTDYVTTHLEGLAFKDDFLKGNTPLDDGFLVTYLLPLSIVLSLAGTLSFMLIFQGMLQKMKRDLTIHLQSGARFRDVLLRFYVLFAAIIGISLAVLHIIGIVDYTSFIGPVIYGTLITIAISISIYIARALKRTNLFENLRGDMV